MSSTFMRGEGFYFPTGLFLHHVTNSKRGLFPTGFPPYVDKLQYFILVPYTRFYPKWFPTCNLNVHSWGRVTRRHGTVDIYVPR